MLNSSSALSTSHQRRIATRQHPSHIIHTESPNVLPVDLNPFNLHQELTDAEPFARDIFQRPWIDVLNTDTMAIAMGWQKPDNVAGSSAPAIMVGLFVASGGLLFGYDTG